MDKSHCKADRLLPFLPLTLAEWYRLHPGHTHEITKHTGALACLDASGFTALTNRLEAAGQDGPEILTQILNAFFASVIKVVRRYGGDVLKFSGDGLWVYLPDPGKVAPFAESAQAAVRELNAKHTYLKTNPLSLHLGAEAGSFELVSFGDARHRLEVEPIGLVVAEAYACCDLAKAGELAVGPGLKSPEEQGRRYPSSAVDWSIRDTTSAPIESTLWRYIPEALIGRLRDGDAAAQLESEYREVTVVFGLCRWNSGGSQGSSSETGAQVNELMHCVQSCEGSLARIDPFKDGHKFLILFGAPVVRADDQWRALQCARQLGRLNRDGFSVRAGVAHGRAFCGAVGSPARMEYTIMGAAANLAARLMAKADWGSVLFDDTMRQLLPGSVVSVPHQLTVKGFAQPITVHRFERIDDLESGSSHDVTADKFMHASYRMALERWRDAVVRNARRAIFVRGGQDVGKSHLLRAAEDAVEPQTRITLDAKQAIFFGPGYLARKLITTLAAQIPEIGVHHLTRWASEQEGAELLPVLKGVLDDVPDDNIWTRDLSAQLRLAKAEELYVGLIHRMLSRHVFVLIDDLDKADALSRKLLLALCRSNAEHDLTLFITGTDTSVIDAEQPGDASDRIDLTCPSEKEWKDFLTSRFVEGRREEEFVQRLIAQSGGLPGLIFDVLSERTAAGDIIMNPVAGKRELKHTSAGTTIPGSARELHLERFDTLPEKLRAVLKPCAVNPAAVDIDTLAFECEESPVQDIRDALNDLCNRGILQKESDHDVYRFASGAFRDVVYGCIPHSDLYVWHTRCAQWIEKNHSDHTPLLAYHYSNTIDVDKGFRYSLKAAETALSVYALADAAAHFESCARLLKRDTGSSIAVSQAVEFHRTLARFLVLEGRPQEAYRTYRTWRRLAASGADKSSVLESALGTAELLWQQSKYVRCTAVLKAALAGVTSSECPELVARGMTLLAEVARRTARFADAESWARKAVVQSDDPLSRADAYNRLGLAMWGQGRLGEAVEHLEKSLASGHGSHSMYNRARIANNLAIVHWQMGELVQAEPLMREAIEVFHRQGDRRNEAYARGNLAALIREFGRHADARRMLSEADLIFDRLGDKHAHFYTVGNLGDIDLVSGDLAKARDRFAEALAFGESVEDSELVAECQVRLGEVAFFAGDSKLAEQSLTAALELSEQIGSTEFALRARVGLARVRVGLREIDLLPELAEKIRHEAQESRTTVMDQEGHFLQGEYLRITGDTQGALKCFEEVFGYARDQRLFELSLKCAVRMIELADRTYSDAGLFLAELSRQYERENGTGSWQAVLDSAYFSFFRPVLTAVMADSPASVAHA